MMTSVFLLQHCYEVNNIEEIKILGIYTSRSKSELVIEKYKKLPGFMNYPNSFVIDEYKLDEDNWAEGFIEV